MSKTVVLLKWIYHLSIFDRFFFENWFTIIIIQYWFIGYSTFNIL